MTYSDVECEIYQAVQGNKRRPSMLFKSYSEVKRRCIRVY